jgi:YVTN family beta-propeller protein
MEEGNMMRIFDRFITGNPKGISGLLFVLTLSIAVGNFSAVVHAQPYGFVTSINVNYASIIDVATNTIASTVSTSGSQRGVAFSPDGSRVYIVDTTTDSVAVVDTATNTVLTNIFVQDVPSIIAINQEGTRAYVTNSYSDSVSVIDTASNIVIATVPVGDYPIGIAVTPDGSRVYTANWYSADLSVIDATTNTFLMSVPLGVGGLYGITITPDGARAYVGGFYTNSVTVVDLASHTVVALVPAGNGGQRGIAITPDGSRVYAANWQVNNVSVIDVATNTWLVNVPVQASPHGIAFTPDGAYAYVVNANSDTISVIETATNMVIDTIPTGPVRPYWIAIATNTPPVADAGDDQSVVQGDTVYLDGSGSYDPDDDLLAYSWSMVSKPAGSAAYIIDPIAVQTSYFTDLPGEYVVSLVVNDGLTDSAPSQVTALAITYKDAATETLQETSDAVNSLDAASFTNANLQNALTNKINATLQLINNDEYVTALAKLDNDILGKTDGCAETGMPDANDWITDCVSQAEVYSLVIETIGYLENLVH